MDKAKAKTLLTKLQNDIKGIKWAGVLKKVTHPQAADDLNNFLESLPQKTNNTILIITGIIWAAAALIGLMTAMQMQKMSQAKIEFEEAQALKPKVPVIENTAVSSQELKDFSERSNKLYKDLEIKSAGSTITISSTALGAFGQFREALAYIQNGGSDWRITIDKLCVGRECKGKPLSATLRVNKVSVRGS